MEILLLSSRGVESNRTIRTGHFAGDKQSYVPLDSQNQDSARRKAVTRVQIGKSQFCHDSPDGSIFLFRSKQLRKNLTFLFN